MYLNARESQKPNPIENSYELSAPKRLDRLPIEVLEFIMSFLRPADLVALAESSAHIEVIVTSSRLWRHATLQLSGGDVYLFLRQLRLAPEVEQLKIGFGSIDPKVAKAVANYDGPIPHVHTLCLSLSALSTELGILLLTKYGQTSRHIKLDLHHCLLEPPRLNFGLLEILPTLSYVESVAVRVDSVHDIIVLNQLVVRLVDIDIHRLRVGDIPQGGPGSLVGVAAAELISHHSSYLRTLSLPLTFDANLCRVVTSCKELRSVACNVWTLPALEHLSNLHTLIVFPPDENVSVQDVHHLISYARRSRNVLANLKELRFVYSYEGCDVLSSLATSDYAQAVVCLLLVLCKSLEVLEVQWDVGELPAGEHAWFTTVLLNNSPKLRELRLHGDQLPLLHFLCLVRCSSSLQILDVRRCETKSLRSRSSKQRLAALPISKKKRALRLLQEAFPKLTVLFDDDAEESCDWNSYSPHHKNADELKQKERQLPRTAEAALSQKSLNKLFLHTQSLDQWASGRGYTKEDLPSWRYATLDSSVWSNQDFTEILRVVPALGLLDCRNRETLSPGRKGHYWIKAVAHGPMHVEAFRIRAVLVSAHLWKLIVPIILRFGKSLRCLDLDFRGRPFREWRDVLSILKELPNLTEFALRGSFKDDRPVLDWLHGHVQSLTRLDLRDCLIETSTQMPEFVESLRKLILELRGTVRAIALPPLPHRLTAPVLRALGELTDLREVALHANDLECVRPLTSLISLELYGDRLPQNRISLCRLALSLRNMHDALKVVRRLTLPAELIKSHFVQEAIFDVMPKLRRFDVIDHVKNLRLCAEGSKCKNEISKLFEI